MNKKNRKNSGFTLVELLVVIIIIGVLLGIGIVAVTGLIDRTKKEQVKSQEQLLVMAAKNYLQENRGLLPKSIGETTTIPISVLKSTKYITDDLVNQNNETCMVNSFVTAYKESATKYSYKAHIYCGNDVVEENDIVATPTVSIDFVDASGKSIKNDAGVLAKVAEAKYIINYDGGTYNSEKVAIDGYSYSILVDLTGGSNLQEVYSSGTLNAVGAYTIHIDKDNNLSDYIDITSATTVVIKATVRNVLGGVSEGVEFLGESAEAAMAVYKDRDDPICGRIIGQAGTNDWITRTTTTQERKISVMCSDGSGSGCIRSKFTNTWSGNVEAATSTIQIKDNAGNTRNCPVVVNIDRKFPVIKMDAFAKGRSENSTTGNSVISGVRSTNVNGVAEIRNDEYANLVDGYMVKSKYPYGVIYKVTLTDLALSSWKWEVNENEIDSISDSRYAVVSSNNVEGKTGNCSNQSSCEIYVYLSENGLRKGVLTVNDKHGNQSVFTVYANINRQAPGAPSIINSSNEKSNGAWTSNDVTLKLSTNLKQSLIDNYYYSFNENADVSNRDGVNDSDANTKWVKLVGGTGQQSFTTAPWRTEMNKTAYIMVCDTSGNCSDSSETDIKIDRTPPTGLVVRGYKKTSSGDVDSPSGLLTINSDVWHNGWVLVVPSGATDVGSGEVDYRFTVTGASQNEVEPVSQNYRNVNREGESIVSYMACDAAENCSSTVDFKVKLDRTAPTMPEVNNSASGEWTKSNVTLTIKNSADTRSGIGKYYYSYASSPSENGTNPKTAWVELVDGRNKTSFSTVWSEEMNETVRIKVCDNVDNCNTDASTFIGIDRTAPTQPTITDTDNNVYAGDWTNQSFSLILNSSDGNGSGLYDCQYTYNSSASQVGDDADTMWKANNGTFNSNRTKFTTTQFVYERDQNAYLRVCDKVGNCSSKATARIRIDKTKPVCGNVEITQDNSENGVIGSVGCSDSGSLCINNTYSFGPVKEDTNVKIKDNAGNIDYCAMYIASYDCSDGPWGNPTLKSKNNNTCGVDGFTDSIYDSGSCLVADNYHTDICSAKCSTACDIYSSSCSKVCCIRRKKKTCYKRDTP